jgi:acyl-homoserine-lactone acylase
MGHTHASGACVFRRLFSARELWSIASWSIMMIRTWTTIALTFAGLACAPFGWADQTTARLERQASQVTIVRDDWGIAHVHGKTDALAVFGMIYAQAEDDFNRIEVNYITNLGRTAEVEGERAIWADLRQRLFVDPEDLKKQYASSPADLKVLMDAWADGLNYYLATHPRVTPKLIKHFEPWMALSFTEGSIGGDISKVSLKDLEALYGENPEAALGDTDALTFKEPKGSNGAAISPKITKNGKALLLINPHTSFYFRSEMQVTSDQGLNAYGAATWGQFFIYQGFNSHAGWMHTTSTVDTVDEFAETITKKEGKFFYRYGAEDRPVKVTILKLPYRTAAGGTANRSFSVYATHHGPVVRAADHRWISVALMNRPVAALQQSFGRTKTRDLASFLKVAAYAANSSNNTLFADDKGETALLLPQFVPMRDNQFDYAKPVDGANPDTDWKGDTALASLPQFVNPKSGWVYNSNDGPWWATGPNALNRADYPRYMDEVGENPRTPHALEVFPARKDFTLQTLIDAAYDTHLPAFARTIPGLTAAYDALPADDAMKAPLREPIEALRAWDSRWAATSVPTSLAVFWGETLFASIAAEAKAAGVKTQDFMADHATPGQKLAAFRSAVDRLTQDFGTWRTPWGAINRFQRLDDAIEPGFDDMGKSFAVPFPSAQWGTLASFGARRYPGTKKYYGSSGNSFVAVVEFGKRITARAVMAGGQSGDPSSKHFSDQIERYAKGDLREVYFYPDQLKGHTERIYRPGK